MFVSEHPKIIEGGIQLINMDVIDTAETSDGGMVDADGAAQDEEYESGLGEAGESTGVTAAETKEVQEAQQDVK